MCPEKATLHFWFIAAADVATDLIELNGNEFQHGDTELRFSQFCGYISLDQAVEYGLQSQIMFFSFGV